MHNTCSKENVTPSAQLPWLTESAPTSAQVDTSLKLQAETASSVTPTVRPVMEPLTSVLHVKLVSPATEPVSLPAQPTLLTSTETVLPALKDATDARPPSTNVQPVNQDTSWSEPSVSPHAMPVISETEPTDARNAQTLASHAHPPPPVPHALKPETNPSTVFVTTVSIHAHHAAHSKSALVV